MVYIWNAFYDAQCPYLLSFPCDCGVIIVITANTNMNMLLQDRAVLILLTICCINYLVFSLTERARHPRIFGVRCSPVSTFALLSVLDATLLSCRTLK